MAHPKRTLYSQFFKLDRMVLIPFGSPPIGSCVKEAMEIAIRNECNVEFFYNERRVFINYREMVERCVLLEEKPLNV